MPPAQDRLRAAAEEYLAAAQDLDADAALAAVRALTSGDHRGCST